jgi:hypothetical protein
MSIIKINYLDEFIPNGITSISDPNLDIFYFYDRLEVSTFFSELKKDKVYIATFEFVPS